jgi:membrane protein YdbS with pleckstrin-like domain
MQSKTITLFNLKNLGNNQNYIRSGSWIYKKYFNSYQKANLRVMIMFVLFWFSTFYLFYFMNFLIENDISSEFLFFFIMLFSLLIIPSFLYKKWKYVFNDYCKTSIITLEDWEIIKKVKKINKEYLSYNLMNKNKELKTTSEILTYLLFFLLTFICMVLIFYYMEVIYMLLQTPFVIFLPYLLPVILAYFIKYPVKIVNFIINFIINFVNNKLCPNKFTSSSWNKIIIY